MPHRIRNDYRPRDTERSKKIQQTKRRKACMIGRAADGNTCFLVNQGKLYISHIGKRDKKEVELYNATMPEYAEVQEKWTADKTVFLERLDALKAMEEEEESKSQEQPMDSTSTDQSNDTSVQVTDNTEQTTT